MFTRSCSGRKRVRWHDNNEIVVGPSNSESQALQKCFSIFEGSNFSRDAKKCLSMFGTSFDFETSSSVSSAFTQPPDPCSSIAVKVI